MLSDSISNQDSSVAHTHVHSCLHMHACTHKYTTRACIHIHGQCTGTCVYTHTPIDMYTYICKYTYKDINTYAYTCTRVCTHIRTHIYHTHTCTHAYKHLHVCTHTFWVPCVYKIWHLYHRNLYSIFTGTHRRNSFCIHALNKCLLSTYYTPH